MLSFKPTFSLSSFTFIKRLFSSSSLSAIRVVSSAYLRLLIFLPAILIPACAYSHPLNCHKINFDSGKMLKVMALKELLMSLWAEMWNIDILSSVEILVKRLFLKGRLAASDIVLYLFFV